MVRPVNQVRQVRGALLANVRKPPYQLSLKRRRPCPRCSGQSRSSGLWHWRSGPARVARRKGHSWLLFFLFSLFPFFPALITAYLARDRRSLAGSTA